MIHKIEISHMYKILITICLIFIMATVAVPQQGVQAITGVSASVDTGLTSSLVHDFFSLKTLFNRNKRAVPKLVKSRDKILAMVDRLREDDNNNWVAMRVLYYDFRSAYYLATNHVYESSVLIYSHPGISDKGKIENASMAKWTVQRLRGSVLGMLARTRECNRILGKANRLMRLSK